MSAPEPTRQAQPSKIPLATQGSSTHVSISLRYKVRHFSFVVHGAPEVHALAPHIADHLIQVPAGGGGRSAPSQSSGELGTKLDRPAPDSLIADLDSAPRHHSLDLAKTEGKAEIQPHRMTDRVGGKAVTLERYRLHKSLSHNGFLSR
jgi:hypothetical protein